MMTDALRFTLTRVARLIAEDRLVRCAAEDLGIDLDVLRKEVASAIADVEEE